MGLRDIYRSPAGERAFFFRVQCGKYRGDHIQAGVDLAQAFARIRRSYPSALIYAIDESKTQLAKDGLPV